MASLAFKLLALASQTGTDAARIEAIVQRHMQLPGAVGLSVALARGDEVVYSRAFGLANLEFPAPVDGETMFRIASTTKQFTAAAILRLAERGKLGLDDPLMGFLPDFPTHGQDITLRHLLTHTSGIPNVTDLGRKWSDLAARELSHEEMLALWKDLPLDFVPGERWKYSNSGYYLLGMVIETVSGQSYGDFLRAEFFEPLKMTRTRLDSNAELIQDRAQGYASANGVFRNDRLIGMSQPFSSGALLSTAGDLVRWQTALVGGRALKPESYEEMKLPFLLADGSETSYGLGLFLSPVAGHPCVWHSGDIFGFNSALAYFPEGKLSIAALSNSEKLSTESLVEELAKALLAPPAKPSGG
jgi:D-alanyl-D-alanine carboxypeptidase